MIVLVHAATCYNSFLSLLLHTVIDAKTYARPLRDIFPYYVVLAAYNSLIMHNGRLAKRLVFKIIEDILNCTIQNLLLTKNSIEPKKQSLILQRFVCVYEY